jgi:hypothetical protein
MRPDTSPSLEGHFPVTSVQPAVYLFLTGFVKKILLLEATNELFVEISLAEVLARKSVSSNLHRLLISTKVPVLEGGTLCRFWTTKTQRASLIHAETQRRGGAGQFSRATLICAEKPRAGAVSSRPAQTR